MFDTLILADNPHANTQVLGLSLVERGRRVAGKLGSGRTLVVTGAADRAALADWDAGRGEAALIVLYAGEQVVHPPLVEPLLAGTQPLRAAVGPEGFAGALWATGESAHAVIAALAAGREPDLAGAEQISHGDLARHLARTPQERAGATRMLLRLISKSEDSPIVRYFYRPLSRPLTRLLVKTPVTPNQVSIVVALIGLCGCWLTAHAGQANLVWGAALVLIAGIIDGCDGEIARLRLEGSKFGAWLDTIIDELTTTVYFVAIGLHTVAEIPDPRLRASIPLGLACYLAAIYGIYYFLVVVSKTGNSQHYIGTLEIDPSGALRAKPRAASTLPPWLRKVGVACSMAIRRDFINLAALGVTFANGYWFIYAAMLAGGALTAVVVVPEHLRLRGQLRELARRGATPRLVSG